MLLAIPGGWGTPGAELHVYSLYPYNQSQILQNVKSTK